MPKNENHPEKQSPKTDIGGKLRPMAITLKAVVVGTDGKVLLLKRSSNEHTNKSKWDLPGGHLEKGQTIEESLKRELEEETGLDIEMGPVISVAEFEKEHKAFKMEKRGLRFIVWAKSDDVKISDEHEEYRWLSLDEAIELLSSEDGFENEKKRTLQAAREYLQLMQSMNGWKRALADMENYKKRRARDNEDFRKFCLEDFILELIPVLDNFDMAIEHMPKDTHSNWTEGIVHIKNQLAEVLRKKGVEEIKAKKGEKIDASKHEVIHANKSNGHAIIKKVLKKGYEMNGKLIRPAHVETE